MSQLLISQNGGTLQVQQTQNNAREEVIGKIMERSSRKTGSWKSVIR
jgi:hypothetical protein